MQRRNIVKYNKLISLIFERKCFLTIQLFSSKRVRSNEYKD